MAQYPNQYDITVHREPSLKGSFIQISKESFSKAYQKLSRSPGALALYIWLVGNKDNYQFEFSPKAILGGLGMAMSTTHDAVRRLRQEGFLIKRIKGANYDFYEVAKEELIKNDDANEIEEYDNSPTIIKANPGEFTF